MLNISAQLRRRRLEKRDLIIDLQYACSALWGGTLIAPLLTQGPWLLPVHCYRITFFMGVSRHNYAARKAAAIRLIEADRVTIENY